MVLNSTKRPQEISLNVDSLEIQSCTEEYICDVIFQQVEKVFPGKVMSRIGSQSNLFDQISITLIRRTRE